MLCTQVDRARIFTCPDSSATAAYLLWKIQTRPNTGYPSPPPASRPVSDSLAAGLSFSSDPAWSKQARCHGQLRGLPYTLAFEQCKRVVVRNGIPARE